MDTRPRCPVMIMKGPFAKEEGALRINWQRQRHCSVVVPCRQIRRSASATSNVAEVAVVVMVHSHSEHYFLKSTPLQPYL